MLCRTGSNILEITLRFRLLSSALGNGVFTTPVHTLKIGWWTGVATNEIKNQPSSKNDGMWEKTLMKKYHMFTFRSNVKPIYTHRKTPFIGVSSSNDKNIYTHVWNLWLAIFHVWFQQVDPNAHKVWQTNEKNSHVCTKMCFTFRMLYCENLMRQYVCGKRQTTAQFLRCHSRHIHALHTFRIWSTLKQALLSPLTFVKKPQKWTSWWVFPLYFSAKSQRKKHLR